MLAQVDRMLSIQRVIAVSGDRVGIEDGFLVLNDMPLPTEAYPLQPASPVEIRGGRLIQPSESVRVGRGRVAVWGVQGGDELVWLGPRVIDEEAIQGKAWVVYSTRNLTWWQKPNLSLNVQCLPDIIPMYC